MSIICSAPIVGAHFRPPAKAILEVLRSGTKLLLRLEPENPYDANAIAVEVEGAEIITFDKTSEAYRHLFELLNDKASGFGYEADEILSAEKWHLGYIKATEAVNIASQLALIQSESATHNGNHEDSVKGIFHCTLSFDVSGKAQANINLT